jgi:hypothetical protein
VGGLLRKKAGEVLKPKPAPTETKPAPEPTPTPAPTPGTSSPGTPATTAATPAAKPAEPATSGDPLDASNLNLTNNINRYVQEDEPVPEGEWSIVPFFGGATTTALKLLDNNGRVAFIEKTGPVIKALVQSDAFGKAHADTIRQRYNAVDHGLAGAKSMEDYMKAKDFAGMEAFGKRQQVMNIVDNVERQSAADIQRTLGYEIESWRQSAQTATGRNKAKYERYVKDGEALATLGTSDEKKLRRGYAVLKSIDMDGPDTEDAVYAMHAAAKRETEQAAWNKHNLNSVLKQQLTAFVAIAGTVDFKAETVVKDDTQKFVNPAYERKGDIWKACFRAGQPATAAARQFAQAWLKEWK